MRVYLDSDGYPNEITFSEQEMDILKSDNFYSLRGLYSKMKKIMDYWEELSESYEARQYGDLDEQEYYNRMVMMQKKHFEDEYVEDYKRMQIW